MSFFVFSFLVTRIPSLPPLVTLSPTFSPLVILNPNFSFPLRVSLPHRLSGIFVAHVFNPLPSRCSKSASSTLQVGTLVRVTLKPTLPPFLVLLKEIGNRPKLSGTSLSEKIYFAMVNIQLFFHLVIFKIEIYQCLLTNNICVRPHE